MFDWPPYFQINEWPKVNALYSKQYAVFFLWWRTTLMQKKQTRKLETERDGKPQTKYIKVINEQRR